MFITDELLTDATGLPADAIRKCTDMGILAPENANARGRGRRRRWGDATVGNAARIVALRRAGLTLFEAAILLAVGGHFWESGTKFPSLISPRDSESTFNRFLKTPAADLRNKRDDLFVEILDGHFVYERTGDTDRELIAQLGDGGVVLAPVDRRARVAGAFDSEIELPIVFGQLSKALAKQHEAQPVTVTVVNLDLAARIAIRKLHDQLGFIPT